MNQPQDPRTAGRGDAGLRAFLGRDLMDTARYRYDPQRALIDQAHECIEQMRTFHDASNSVANQLATLAVQVQRRDHLITELRKQLDGAIKLAERHGAQVEPWTFPEHTAPTPTTPEGTPPL